MRDREIDAMMDVLGSVLRGLDVVSTVLAVAALPLLALAAIGRYRHPATRPRPSSGRGWLSMTFVVVAAASALVAGLLGDVPLAGGWPFAAVAVLVIVTFAGDDEFWPVAAGLFVLFTAIGLVLLFGSATSYVDDETGYRWYGSRWLVWLAGVGANPTRDGWQVSVASAAVLRFGLPLALMVAATYQAATRPDLSRVARLGLSLVAGVAVTGVFGSAAYLMVAFTVGVFSGLPPVLGAAGVLGSLLIVLLVGPGAVDALLVGGRTIWSWLPGRSLQLVGAAATVRDVHDVIGENRSGRSEAGGGRGLVRWALDNVGWSSRLWVRGFVLLAVLGVLGWAGIWGTRNTPDTVSFQPIDSEVDVDFVVQAAHPATNGRSWLVGDGRVALFDPVDGTVLPVDSGGDVVAVASGAEAGALFGLTAVQPPALLRFADDGAPAAELGVLQGLPGGVGTSLAVSGDVIYAAAPDGSIGRWPTTGGEPSARVADVPGVELAGVTSGGLWTVRYGTGELLGDVATGRRDPQSLAPIAAASLPAAASDLAVGADGMIYSLIMGSIVAIDGATGEPAWGTAGEFEDA